MPHPPVAPTASFAARADLRRSCRLLAALRHEQRDPARFYGALALDTATMVADLYRDATGRELRGSTVLDVGGGPGYFAAEFAARGACYLPVEPDPAELRATGSVVAGAVRGCGAALPFGDKTVDICVSSNVAEHVATPWAMAAEMLRVTKPGGLMVLSYTVWLGPFGGHETGPWHYLGGDYACKRYQRKHGKPPKNRYGESLFAVRVADGLRWAKLVTRAENETGGIVLATFPRYHPRWAWWLVRAPVLRELLVSNLVLVMGKR
jgi:SAM-dependent methyltransferase